MQKPLLNDGVVSGVICWFYAFIINPVNVIVFGLKISINAILIVAGSMLIAWFFPKKIVEE